MHKLRWPGWTVALVLALCAPVVSWGRALPPLRRVNAPYFADRIRYAEMAIFWFGRVTSADNYADVRMGYDARELYVSLAAFDRRLWYQTSPATNDLTGWDAATLYLKMDGNVGGQPDVNTYRFVGQLNWWEPRDRWQAAYRGNGVGWVSATVPFTTTTGWRGDAPNDDVDDRGWILTFRIPFSGLGLASAPPQGTVWGLAVALHDRDDPNGLPNAGQVWPEGMVPDRPLTWGQLAFGLPTFTHQPSGPAQTVTIREGLNGARVVDGAVGGGTTCGEGLDYWTLWGQANYGGVLNFNVQNQEDISDWPCFSKYYVTFPLGAIPAGKVVVSATLTLHQFGNAGQGWNPGPQPSFLQVLTIGQDWDESTLTWNNAPLARENITGAWVNPLDSYPGEPGVPRTWDVSQAVAEAYAASAPVRLALYSADGAYHSGRYFWSSDHDDHPPEARPTLTVLWGEPLATVDKTVWPPNPAYQQPATCTIFFRGSGRPLTLTDDLPAQVSSPGLVQVNGGIVTYSPDAHQVTWTGSPSVGHGITLAFPVTMLVPGPVAVRNTAVLTDGTVWVSADAALLIIDARQVWLPLVLRR